MKKLPLIGSGRTYALATVPLIKWLIDREPEVQAALTEFADDKRASPISVAGPPSEEDLARRAKRDDNTEPLALPVVSLICTKTKFPRSVRVTLSDRDFTELVEWHRRARKTQDQQIENAKRMAVS